jgi:hypothetical protein
VVTFPWEISATHDLKDLIEIQGRSLHYLRELQAGEFVSTGLTGFGPTERSHRIRIFNHEVKAGVLIATDKPLIRMNFWSPRTTLCPEPYIEMEIEPLKRETWETRYEFFVR